MAATLESGPLVHEYSVVAQLGAHHITGIELGFDRAIRTGKALAEAGYRVTVRSADPFLEDCVTCTLVRDRA